MRGTCWVTIDQWEERSCHWCHGSVSRLILCSTHRGHLKMDRIKKVTEKSQTFADINKQTRILFMALRVEKNGQSIASRKLLTILTCYIHYAKHIPQIHRITLRPIANPKSYSEMVCLWTTWNSFLLSLKFTTLSLWNDINRSFFDKDSAHITPRLLAAAGS